MVGLNLSQRIAGQTVQVEMVSIDRDTGQPDEQHIACWRIDGASATQAIFEVATNGSPRLMPAASTITSTAKGIFTLAAYRLNEIAGRSWRHDA